MNISILGCGWLGFPLAQKLIQLGHLVKGSTTTDDKIMHLKQHGIAPFLISLSEQEVLGDIAGFLQDAGILIIDIPPKLRGNATENFVAKIKNLFPYIEKAGVANVIFVSSTSVYGDQQKIVDEASVPFPDTEGGKQLLEVEQLLLGHVSFEAIVLRFGGLIGADRHPVHFLAGKQQLENPDAPVNFIHQKDCIAILESLVVSGEWNQIYNAVAPFHPTRKDYYTHKAIEFGLVPPRFSSEKKSSQKLILSNKIIKKLHYTFNIDLY